ncbi:hypothetical protein NKI32_31150 [Mesorhizobium sp. M0761]|uniref:hypothetical protein n=1 Tax=Mesorhizobium sp. M0761 TaxID=2956994 RepID=UPI003339094E
MRAVAGHPIAVCFLTFIVSRIGLSPFVGVDVCKDGWHSMSIGRRGACSWHGGVGGLDHGNWVLPATIALGVAAGFAWSALRAKWSETATPVEEWGPVYVPQPEEPPSRPKISSEVSGQEGMQSVLKQSGWLACPVCAAEMKPRMAHRGRYGGRDFWGCSRYPSCNEIMNIKPAVAKTGPLPTAGFGSATAALEPEELARLREQTRQATKESAAYIAAELAKAKLRNERRGNSSHLGKSRSYRKRNR